MKRIEQEIVMLCNEIDYWKAQAEKWKKMYDEMSKELSDYHSHSINHNQEMMGNFIKLALNSDEKSIKKAFGKK